jgi:hypothetical protein
MLPVMERTLTPSKLLLVSNHRIGPVAGRGRPEPIRRYRIARLQLEGRPTPPSQRFEYLKRVFD